MRKHEATVTRKGQVTIPVEIRRALGLADGGPIAFTLEGNRVVLHSAKKPTLSELLNGFDPDRHRRDATEREWDDAPRGGEIF